MERKPDWKVFRNIPSVLLWVGPQFNSIRTATQDGRKIRFDLIYLMTIQDTKDNATLEVRSISGDMYSTLSGLPALLLRTLL